MKAHDAYPLAERIRDELSPYCSQIEIAGSLRRGRAEVNDIDLVCMPKDGLAGGDFGDMTCHQALVARCKRRTQVVREGASNLVLRLQAPGRPFHLFHVDLFFAAPARRDLITATPSNWGTVLLCRTGSREHNVYLCQKAEALGLKWCTSQGICEVKPSGDVVRILASATEEEMFAALGMQWIPPAARER